MNVGQATKYAGLWWEDNKVLGRGRSAVTIQRTMGCSLCPFTTRRGRVKNALAAVQAMRGEVFAHIRERHQEALK